MRLAVAVLGVKVQSWPMMGLAVVGISLGFTGLMMLIAGLSRTEGAAQGYARAIMLVLAMIGGGSIPTAFMPPLMKKLSGVSPFKWAVDAIEGAMELAESSGYTYHVIKVCGTVVCHKTAEWKGAD